MRDGVQGPISISVVGLIYFLHALRNPFMLVFIKLPWLIKCKYPTMTTSKLCYLRNMHDKNNELRSSSSLTKIQIFLSWPTQSCCQMQELYRPSADTVRSSTSSHWLVLQATDSTFALHCVVVIFSKLQLLLAVYLFSCQKNDVVGVGEEASGVFIKSNLFLNSRECD